MAIDLPTLRQNPIFQATAPPKSLTATLKSFSTVDQAIEKKLKQSNQLITAGVITSFGSFFLFVLAIGFVTLPIGIGLLIWGIVLKNQYKGLNIPNYRYELLAELVPMLGRDMAANQPLKLTFDTRPPDIPSKKIETISHPRRARWKIDRFEDPWLELTGEFLDGTHFEIAAIEHFQSHHGWKRSRSGKSKHKRKPKPKGQELELRLVCPRSKYGALTVLKEDIPAAVKLPPETRLKTVGSKDNKLRLLVKTSPYMGSQELYKTFSMMFLSLYHVLNLSRQLSKKTS